MRFLVPPAPTKALSPLTLRGPSPLPQRHVDPRPPGTQGPRPAPAPPPAGASRPPGRALASVAAGGTGPGGSVPCGRGKRMRFLFPPGGAFLLIALSGTDRDRGRRKTSRRHPLHWQGPSPLPLCHADPVPAGGPKPPASARPAPGGRFSPAGSGAGLCRCGWHGSWWQRSARAGKRSAFPHPARTNESTFSAPVAGAIAPAKMRWRKCVPPFGQAAPAVGTFSAPEALARDAPILGA